MSNSLVNSNARPNLVLTKIAQAYSQTELIGSLVLPETTENQANFTVPIYGKDFLKAAQTLRAPGADPAKTKMDAMDTVKIGLDEYALYETVDRQELEDGDINKLKVYKTKLVTQQLLNGRELAIANVVMDYSKYSATTNKATLSTTTQWSHADSDPYQAIMDAKSKIRLATGVSPNQLTIGEKAWAALSSNVKLRQRMTDARVGIITKDVITTFLELEAINVGSAINRSEAGANSFIWGNNAVLHYTPRVATPNKYEPSFGYSFKRAGNPRVVESSNSFGDVTQIAAYYQYAVKVLNYDVAFMFKDVSGL